MSRLQKLILYKLG